MRLCILPDFTQKADIGKIDFFESPEIKQVNDDWDCEGCECKKEARIYKMHCAKDSDSEFLIHAQTKQCKIIFNRIITIEFPQAVCQFNCSLPVVLFPFK
jgi:hypothetical protein